MVRIVEGGEGVAILNPPQQRFFEFPPTRLQRVPEPNAAGRARGTQAPPAAEGFWLGAFVLTVDLTWLRDGEALTLEALVRMQAGSEYLTLFETEFTRSQGRRLWQSRPLYSLFGCAFQGTQTQGTSDVRLPWFVVQVDAPS